MSNQKLYFVIHLTIGGLKHTQFMLTDKKPVPADICRGEGSCLVFKLCDGDYSTAFADALEDGRVINDLGNYWVNADVSGISSLKKEWLEKLEAFKSNNNGDK